MRHSKDSTHGNNLKLVVVFLSSVFFLIAVVMTVRFVHLVKKSNFDGIHRFTIFITSEKNHSGAISFAPDTNSISVLELNNAAHLSYLKTIMRIPVDGYITFKEKAGNLSLVISDVNQKEYPSSFKSNFPSFILKYGEINTNLTIIDCIRLWFFTMSVPNHAFSTKQFIVDSKDGDSETSNIDSVLSFLFTDQTFSKEQASIQIVNATAISGLGNKLAKVITNMGGNVVSVSTADSIVKNSSISYFGDKKYAVIKLANMLQFPIQEMKQTAISDIIVTVGKDYKESVFLKL